MPMLLNLIIALVGLLLLVWGAERFVHGAAGLARSLGVSTLVIGLTVVSLGTSAPELLVNFTAQLTGAPAMAFGNVVGSNIANIGLVLGVSALLLPLTVHSQVLRREYPLLLGVTILLGAMIMDEGLQPLEGLLLTIGLGGYAYWTFRDARRTEDDPFLAEVTEDVPEALPMGKAVLWLLVGLAGLVLGSRGLVFGAAEMAQAVGISDLVIGLTLVAFGTSLPELAASLAAVAKKEDDLVVGNVVGSCLLNILLVLGVPAMIGGMPAGPEAVWRDLPVLIGLTLILGPLFINGPRGSYRINRLEGGVLVVAYVGYVFWVIQSSLGGGGA
ncbi:MAG: calcium/sodium antiporter [Thiohalorhabdus sp.]|uniref:calcium/sodium antiporter n=1 Tax=Thiohalorhabdus sp. TaxID=3094134 RepID=UPI003980923C